MERQYTLPKYWECPSTKSFPQFRQVLACRNVSAGIGGRLSAALPLAISFCAFFLLHRVVLETPKVYIKQKAYLAEFRPGPFRKLRYTHYAILRSRGAAYVLSNNEVINSISPAKTLTSQYATSQESSRHVEVNKVGSLLLQHHVVTPDSQSKGQTQQSASYTI